jgi:hypothetical protein
MKCPDCPVAGRCIVDWTAHRPFCRWAASGDAARRARIVEMSVDPPDAPPAEFAPQSREGVAESWALTRRMKACPHRAVDPGCGCSGARCALKPGAVVSHRDCFACLKGN